MVLFLVVGVCSLLIDVVVSKIFMFTSNLGEIISICLIFVFNALNKKTYIHPRNLTWPLKISRNPKGKDRFPTIILGIQPLVFRECSRSVFGRTSKADDWKIRPGVVRVPTSSPLWEKSSHLFGTLKRIFRFFRFQSKEW